MTAPPEATPSADPGPVAGSEPSATPTPGADGGDQPQPEPVLPHLGPLGPALAGAGRLLESLPAFISRTSILWAGKDAKAGAFWLNATRGFEALETSRLGKASIAISNPILRATGNAPWARSVLYHTLWKPVSAIYGFRVGVTGRALTRLIQTDVQIPPKFGFGSIFRNIEAPAYRFGQAVRGVGRALGPALRVLGGVASAAGLAQDIQSGDVASGVGNALGSAAATVPGPAGKVLAAGALGYAIGTVINKHAVEPLIDKAAPGSGPLGDWYYRTFLK